MLNFIMTKKRVSTRTIVDKSPTELHIKHIHHTDIIEKGKGIKSNIPICVIKIYFNREKMVVVDGNHRLQWCRDNNKETIKCWVIDEGDKEKIKANTQNIKDYVNGEISFEELRRGALIAMRKCKKQR